MAPDPHPYGVRLVITIVLPRNAGAEGSMMMACHGFWRESDPGLWYVGLRSLSPSRWHFVACRAVRTRPNAGSTLTATLSRVPAGRFGFRPDPLPDPGSIGLNFVQFQHLGCMIRRVQQLARGVGFRLGI